MGLSWERGGAQDGPGYDYELGVITLWQPWASLWCAGVKRWETRPFRPRRRPRLVAVVAGLHWSEDQEKLARGADVIGALAELPGWGFYTGRTRRPVGHIIGVVALGGCYPTDSLRNVVSAREWRLGDWSDGRWCWKRTAGLTFSVPDMIPWRGSQGLREAPPELAREILVRAPSLEKT